jgi:hypothetical protein
MAAVESDRDPQDRGEGAHDELVLVGEPLVLGMARLRAALAVVAGDERDHLDLVVREAGELAVADHVIGVQVVLAVGDHHADVCEQRCRLEVVTAVVREMVDELRRVVELECEVCDVLGVADVAVASLGELAHAAAGHVTEVVDLTTLHARDGVEQHALAERALAEGHGRDRERLGDALQHQRTGDDDVGARRIETAELGARLGCRTGDERLDHDVELTTRELESIERARRRVAA